MYASSSSSSALTSRPASQYLPEVGVSRHPIRFINVDLPEPDGPMMATYSPRRISTLTPRSACTCSEPISYVFQRSSVLMANPWSTRSWRNESGETASTGISQLLEFSILQKTLRLCGSCLFILTKEGQARHKSFLSTYRLMLLNSGCRPLLLAGSCQFSPGHPASASAAPYSSR